MEDRLGEFVQLFEGEAASAAEVVGLIEDCCDSSLLPDWR
jgi:hypothetical protein